MTVPSDHDIILALAEDLPVGIWVARAPTGVEVYANRAFAELMGVGLQPDVAVGKYSEPYGILTRDRTPYPEARMPFVRALAEQRVGQPVYDITPVCMQWLGLTRREDLPEYSTFLASHDVATPLPEGENASHNTTSGVE